MSDTTTVRVRKATRDRLARLSRQLQTASTEDVVTQALELLETDLFWRQWQSIHEATTPQARADEQAITSAWERAGARDWATDADR
ncbi:MAG TPA: hypothetical protein VES02_05295 [Dermatophilaceae bacterium]|nr:hypothetical protein [Dermatophilaceae bacterium]